MCNSVPCSIIGEHRASSFSTPKPVRGQCLPANIHQLRSCKQQERNASGVNKNIDGENDHTRKQRFQQLDSLRNELFSVTLVSAINKSGARVRLHYDR